MADPDKPQVGPPAALGDPEDQTKVTKVVGLSREGPRARDACLVQIYGPDLGKRYPLDRPETTLGRDFRDRAGVLNQRVASVADEVYWMVFGIPMRVK